MSNRIAILVLLLLSGSVSAMQIHPIDVRPKKGLCARLGDCLCFCKARKRKKQALRNRSLLSAKSADLRRATNGMISEEAIKAIKQAQRDQAVENKVFKVEDTAQHVTAAAMRVITPTPTLPVLFSFSDQSTARTSTLSLPTPQQQISPTPPTTLSQATHSLHVEDV